MSDAQYKRVLYRTDPAYRARVIARVSAYQRKKAADPLWCELQQTRKDVIRIRDTYERMSARAERQFVRLDGLLKRLAVLKGQWKSRKCALDVVDLG